MNRNFGRKFLLTAHAGAEGTTPNGANSLAWMEDQLPEAFEVDVRYLSDKKLLYLSHDLWTSEASEDPLLLEEAFLRARATRRENGEPVLLNLDLKEDGLLPPVLDLAGRLEVFDQIILTGNVSLDAYEAEIQKRGKAARLFWNPEVAVPDFYSLSSYDAIHRLPLQQMQRCNVQVLNIHYRMFTASFQRYCHNMGLRASLWTIDELDDARGLLNVSTLANITTTRYRALDQLRTDDRSPSFSRMEG